MGIPLFYAHRINNEGKKKPAFETYGKPVHFKTGWGTREPSGKAYGHVNESLPVGLFQGVILLQCFPITACVKCDHVYCLYNIWDVDEDTRASEGNRGNRSKGSGPQGPGSCMDKWDNEQHPGTPLIAHHGTFTPHPDRGGTELRIH